MTSTVTVSDRWHHPRLPPFTPVLVRSDREVQVGLDCADVLVLADVDPALVEVLALLDGRHPLAELRARADGLGIGAGELEWSLRTLDQAGLLSEGARPATAGLPLRGRGARIRLVGAGRLGRAVGELLVASRADVVYVVDDSPPDPSLYPAGVAASQADALVAYLCAGPTRGAGPTRLVALNHWSKPDARRPDLTVVASEHLEVDRVLAEGLVRDDQPHLLLRPRAGGVVVGPLVVPGRTACLRCTDLTRRDADPVWPRLLPQLMRTRSAVTPALVGWAAGVAVAQVLAYLQGEAPESAGATVEIAAADHLTRWRAWPMHAGCGCGWTGTADWGP